MGGKAILIVVLGFSLIFLIMEKNIGSASTRSVGNMANYHATETAHNIAVSGANIGANQIYLNPSWTTGYSNINYQNGKINVTVDVLDAFKQILRINSYGTFRGITDTVQVTLQPSKFSKFAYYSESEGSGTIWWTTGDTVWGPLHSQDVMNIDGTPVFMGKVSSKEALNLRKGATPQFLGGFEQGVDLELPENGVINLKSKAQNGGAYITGKRTVYIEFKGDDILKMSPGKKGLVLLQLILHISNATHPILIDQPEDNLDNRTIYNELKSFLKKRKLLRQVILVTHNANLVVSTDSENVIVCNQSGEQINMDNFKYRFEYVTGALENTFYRKSAKGILYKYGIREHVCDTLEGGEEAFKQRELKYGFTYL